MAALHGTVEEALTDALTGSTSVPSTIAGIRGALGGNAAVARALNNIGPGARLPLPGTAARRRYNADIAAVRRGANYELQVAGRQRRQPGAELVERVQHAGRLALAGPRLDRARRNGLDMIVAAWIRVSQDCDYHVMPAPAAGRDIWQAVPDPRFGGDVGPALTAWTAGRYDDAGELLLAAFFRAYGLDAELCDEGVEGAAAKVR